MSTTKTISQKPNSYKTSVIDDATDKHLAEWVSTTRRTDEERQVIAGDIFAVMTAKVEAA